MGLVELVDEFYKLKLSKNYYRNLYSYRKVSIEIFIEDIF